jgi:hypothetical protein
VGSIFEAFPIPQGGVQCLGAGWTNSGQDHQQNGFDYCRSLNEPIPFQERLPQFGLIEYSEISIDQSPVSSVELKMGKPISAAAIE